MTDSVPPRIEAAILTYGARADVLEKTLASLRGTDWGEEPTVFPDTGTHPNPQVRQVFACRQMLTEAVGRPWDYLLFLEDDVEFNTHLRHNLLTWAPLLAGRVSLASLYRPGGVGFVAEGPRVGVPDYDKIYGSQAFLMSRACVTHILDNYDRGVGGQDIRFSRLAAELGPVYFHVPSLVQHVGRVSSWGGGFHQAPDFDREYRA